MDEIRKQKLHLGLNLVSNRNFQWGGVGIKIHQLKSQDESAWWDVAAIVGVLAIVALFPKEAKAASSVDLQVANSTGPAIEFFDANLTENGIFNDENRFPDPDKDTREVLKPLEAATNKWKVRPGNLCTNDRFLVGGRIGFNENSPEGPKVNRDLVEGMLGLMWKAGKYDSKIWKGLKDENGRGFKNLDAAVEYALSGKPLTGFMIPKLNLNGENDTGWCRRGDRSS